MKRLLCLLFAALFALCACCEEWVADDDEMPDEDMEEITEDEIFSEISSDEASDSFSLPDSPLYYGQIYKTGGYMFADKECTQRIASLRGGTRLSIWYVDPNVAYVKTRSGMEQEGWMLRSKLDNVTSADPENIPPYGVEVFTLWAECVQPTPILASPETGSEVLITLYEGARFGIIGVENGWAKLIYHRQYGYVDTRLLDALNPVKADVNETEVEGPIAVYTSYYKITLTGSNPSRMHNIEVACARMSAIPLAPGDKLDFNAQIGPYRASTGYEKAGTITASGLVDNYGGGTCQVSSTTYNVLLQLPGMYVLKRRAHGPSGASYLPHGVDAAVGNKALNLVFRNDYDFTIRIDASAQDGALFIAFWREESQ